ncbi:MAG: 3TM-type holin [Desulfovibrionaceae bacterium]
MLPFLALAANLVPSIVGLFSIKGEEATKKVASAVCAVAGVDDPNEAATRIQANPALQAQLKADLERIELEFYREDTERLRIVNETMRAEGASGDPWQRRWRPWFGFVAGGAFGVQIFGLMFVGGWAVVAKPEQAPAIINSLGLLAGSLGTTWAVALAVLGVQVMGRTKEKTAAAGGQIGGGIAGAVQGLAAMFGGKK